nr:immunoglobulin heavy chain junction region [Mus musculus]MBK4196133.1 immunoglobulin heavy chain junction region [Mus musculus]
CARAGDFYYGSSPFDYW